MATLMEKEVLMDLTTSARALLIQHEPAEDLKSDEWHLRCFYDALVNNPPEIFDFKNMAAKISEIYKKYEFSE